MEFERARLDREGAVAILSMNHPEVLNAVSPEMLKGLTDALDALAELERTDPVLGDHRRGTRVFRPGPTCRDAAMARCRVAPARRWRRCTIHFLRRLRDLPYPIITAVNGPAAGAGMSIALMGDLIVCARSAYFLQAFRRIGLVPDCGSTWLLPRLIGRARAIELSLLGERLPAETALAWGLVTRVFDDATLMAEARSTGARACRRSNRRARPHPAPLLGESRERLRAAARSRMPHAAHRRRLGGLWRGRHGVFGEAAGPIRREVIVARIVCRTGARANRETRLDGVQSCYQE